MFEVDTNKNPLETQALGAAVSTSRDSSLDLDFKAAQEVVRERSPEGHESLIAGLSSALDPRERTFAAMSLGYLGDPKVIPALEMAILTPGENIFVLEAALRSLAQYGETASHSSLSVSRLVHHESAIVRAAAVQALDALKPEAEFLASVLGSRLTDPAIGVRREVGRTLAELSPEHLTDLVPRAVHLLEIGEGDRRLVADLIKIIEKAGRELPEAASVVRARLRDCDGDIRVVAAQTLGRMGPGAMIAGWDLTSIVINPLENPICRRESAVALRVHRHFDPEVLMDLGRVIEEEILENNQQKIREIVSLKREVIELIGDFGPMAQKAAPSLRFALRSEEALLITAAAEALAKVEAYEILIDSLNSTDVLVMQAITDAIRSIVHKIRPSKRAKLIALLKLKFGWVKEPRLMDSIVALLRSLEAAEQAEKEPSLEPPVNLGMTLLA